MAGEGGSRGPQSMLEAPHPGVCGHWWIASSGHSAVGTDPADRPPSLWFCDTLFGLWHDSQPPDCLLWPTVPKLPPASSADHGYILLLCQRTKSRAAGFVPTVEVPLSALPQCLPMDVGL